MKLIVALIDFSDVTAGVIALASSVARVMNSQLVLLHVAMPNADSKDGERQENGSRKEIAGDLRRRRRKLQILKIGLKKQGTNVAAMIVRGTSSRGNPVEKIVHEVHRLEPDLIVMGSHGHGRLYQLLVGSVANAVVRKARRPVLLVPSPLQAPKHA